MMLKDALKEVESLGKYRLMVSNCEMKCGCFPFVEQVKKMDGYSDLSFPILFVVEDAGKLFAVAGVSSKETGVNLDYIAHDRGVEMDEMLDGFATVIDLTMLDDGSHSMLQKV